MVLAAAWLVWMRPGPMSWGFFLYIIWFNPGQAFLFYAWLQQWPPLLLLQNLAGSLAEAAGYAGFLIFALRVPDDRLDPGGGRWSVWCRWSASPWRWPWRRPMATSSATPPSSSPVPPSPAG